MLKPIAKFFIAITWAVAGWWTKKTGTDITDLIESGQIQQVLIAELNYIGDKLFITPALRAIKQTYPKIKITVLAGSRLSGEILTNNPYIDELIFAPSYWSLFMLALKARGKFDLLIDYSANFYYAFLLALMGIKNRIGTEPRQKILFKERDGFDWLYTYSQKIAENEYVPTYFLRLLEPLNIESRDSQMEIFLGEKTIKDFEPNSYVVFHPGVKDIGKAWPTQSWRALTVAAIDKLNLKIVFTGSGSDRELVEEICSNLDKKSAVNLAGELDLLQTAALINSAQVFVGLDTGPLHMAVALKKPIVAIFNKTHPQNYLPQKDNIIVLNTPEKCKEHFAFDYIRSNRGYKNLECLNFIKPADVLAALKKLL